MAGIFNLFDGTVDADRHYLMHSKSPNLKNDGIVKGIPQIKPKGLSMRTSSEINISTNRQSTYVKKDETKKLHNPEVSCLKSTPKSTKTITMQTANIKKFSQKKLCNSIEKELFKKPVTPEDNNEETLFPEPEVLAPYCDPESEFDDTYLPLKNGQMMYSEDIDEGYKSEPEVLSCPEVPTIYEYSDLSTEEYDICETTMELPEISDDED